MNRIWNKIGSRTLVYGGDWDSARSTVRASTFAKLIELARDKVQYYVSDLYHDALWVDKYLNGPMEFEWVARESGTWIGDEALLVRDDQYTNQTRYKFELTVTDRQQWVLDTYEQIEEPKCTGHMVFGSLQHDGNTCPIHEKYSWADRHAALDITECENATAIEGCIFHPAPVNGWTKEEEVFTPEIKETSQEDLDEIMKLLFEPNIPTLRNDENSAPNVPDRKVNGMYDIIRDLRDKLEGAEAAKNELEEGKYELDEKIDELDTYIDEMNSLIDSLDSLPEVSVSFELSVDFDS